MAFLKGTMMGWLNSDVKGILVLQSEVTSPKTSFRAERSTIFVLVPSLSAIFWAALGFFYGDLTIVEGYRIQFIALFFCPVRNYGGIWSTAKNNYAFFFVFHLFHLLLGDLYFFRLQTIFGIYQFSLIP